MPVSDANTPQFLNFIGGFFVYFLLPTIHNIVLLLFGLLVIIST